MKRTIPLLALAALTACADDAPQPTSAPIHGIHPQATVTGALPPTRQYWKDANTLWVYNSQPEVGLTTSYGDPSDATALAAAHSRLVRVTLSWDNTMEDYPYHYTPKFYGFAAAVANYKAQGLEPVIVVVYDENDGGPPPGLTMQYYLQPDMTEFNQRYAAYLSAAATAFPDVKFWEIWNEVDGGYWGQPWGSWDPSSGSFPRYQQGLRYAQTLKVAYPALKAAQPNDWVLLTSLTGTETMVPQGSGYAVGPTESWNFLAGVYDGGGAPYFDFMNVHAYGSAPTGSQAYGSMSTKAQALLSIMQSREGSQTRPMWLTEYGTFAAQYLADHGNVWPHQLGEDDGATFDAHQLDWWRGAMTYLASGPYVKGTGFGFRTPVGAPSGGIYANGRSDADYGAGVQYGDATPRPTYSMLASSTFNDAVFANPLGQGDLSVYSPYANPIGYTYTRNGAYVTINGVQVDNLVPTVIKFQQSASPLSVTISGPSTVRSGSTCSWTANPTGGTAPYSYAWAGVTGDRSSETTTSRWTTVGNKTITLSVSDANGITATASKGISVTSSGGSCSIL